ncbi:MAG: hypothetical protein QOH12_2170 [Solirubrobacteraceae bacterium]|jgi:hypothetical protein|nr:hypothetical protein [Solirubrobacteraceae bacterium]
MTRGMQLDDPTRLACLEEEPPAVEECSPDDDLAAYAHPNSTALATAGARSSVVAGERSSSNSVSAAAAQKAQASSNAAMTTTLQAPAAAQASVEHVPGELTSCPAGVTDTSEIPSGWTEYERDKTWWFHCGFRTLLEKRRPTPEDPIQECVYDHSGTLVDKHHAYADCRGTPDQYTHDQRFLHAVWDSGGIWAHGLPAYLESKRYRRDEEKRRAQQHHPTP